MPRKNPGFNAAAKKEGSGINAAVDARGNTALHLAVEKNDRALVERLTRIGADPNQGDKSGQTPLYVAITARNIEMAALLVDRGALLELRDDKKRTPLDWAIENEAPVGFIASLRDLGADPEISGNADTKRSALHLAAEKNRPDIIEYLYATGLSLDRRDATGATALHVAVTNKSNEALQKLLEYGANAVIRNNQIETPLHLAAKQGNEAAADALLAVQDVRRGVNDHKTYSYGHTPLIAAVEANKPALIAKIVAVGGDVNQTDNQNRNSLFIAVENGHVEAAKLLIALGADCKTASPSGYNKSTMVHAVSDKNYAAMLLLLFNGGFDLNAKDGSGNTALNKAAESQSKERVRALLALGADPNIANDYGRRPLDTIMDHYSFSYNDHSEIIGMLVSHGADVNISNSAAMQQSPLHIAARNGNLTVLKMIASHNASIDQPSKNADGMTPFLLALESGKTACADFLRERGANVFKLDNWKRGALHFAARGGDEKSLESLLALPGMEDRINDRDSRGRTPMHHAFRKYHSDFGVELIKKGARTDIHDETGLTPLHQAIETNYTADWLDDVKEALGDKGDWNLAATDGDTLLHAAARHNQGPVVDKLLEFGANPALPGRHGQYALHAAIISDNEGIAQTLVKAMTEGGHDLDAATDKNGWTALHYAASRDNAQFARMVLEAGAQVNAVASHGETPLHVAARTGKLFAMQALLNHGADMMAQNEKGQTPLDIAVEFKRNDFVQALMMAAAQRAAAEAKAADDAAAKQAAAANGNEKPDALIDPNPKKPAAPKGPMP